MTPPDPSPTPGAAPLGTPLVTSPGLGTSTDPGLAAVAATPASPAGASSAAPGPAAPAYADAVQPDDPFAELPFADRPEIQLGIAFGASFVLAKLLKSLAS